MEHTKETKIIQNEGCSELAKKKERRHFDTKTSQF